MIQKFLPNKTEKKFICNLRINYERSIKKSLDNRREKNLKKREKKEILSREN